MKLSDISAQLVQLNAEATELFNKGERSAEENAAFDTLLNKIDALKEEKARIERMENLAAPAPRKVGAGPVIQTKTNFVNSGEYFKAVANAAAGNVDPRLLNAAGDYVQELSNPDGGFALLPDARSQILQAISGPTSILGRMDTIFCSGNSLTLPYDETPVWSSAGITGATTAEAAAIAPSNPVFGQFSVTLAKTGALVYVTEEMLSDVANIGNYVINKTGSVLEWKMNAAAFTSFTAAPSLKTVAETNGAGVLPPSLTDVQSMWNAMHVGFRTNAVWLINPNLETAMMNWVIGQTPVYIPAGGLSGAPYATLFGKPVIVSELCSAVGAVGDIVLVDPSSFYAVLKNGGVNNAISAHFKFDQELVAYRATVRAAFKSKLAAVITRPDATTCSNVVVLATRV